MFALLVAIGAASAQTDPGVRSSTGVNAGGPLPDLSTAAAKFFDNGETRFETPEVVSGGTNNGLGPRFNLNQCSTCHSQPAPGGSSPNINQYPFVSVNPESQVIKNGIAVSPPNSIPSFVLVNGPVREARFPFFIENGQVTKTADGGVHDLFTVQGRSDAGNCVLAPPNFAQAEQLNDIIFRIPTPVFGLGFMENIGETTLIDNFNSQIGNSFGISGAFNYNGNDGTISRFGWKAQNKSGLLFAGEAYNVEMGITNELFQNERPNPDEEHNFIGLPSSCLNLDGAGYPEDSTNFTATGPAIPSDIVAFGIFMRLLAQPTPQPQGYSTATTTVTAQSIARGLSGFTSVGCATCHTPTLETDPSSIDGDLSGKPANLYSDIEIHHMGGLADNVMQGTAGGDQFRTAPLWGVGQRIFFLHDGRAPDLLTAITDHCLPVATSGSEASQGSEACTVVTNFQNLPPTSGAANTVSQQDVLNFLRSL
ncbi:MAG: thiol oxidoreductase [Acidobacteriaceae bacterium]|nr:thiol oxidoreductase [Acidobacteriaceae bacterium]